MRSLPAVVSLVAAISGCAPSPPPASPSPPARVSALPVRSVRLYETGVGYFERQGKLSPGADSISLPASHVDDALKTLIVLSDGAPLRVSAVEFESVSSEGLARAQAGLPPGTERRLTYAVVLESLRGLEVEVTRTNGVPLVGRLVDVTEVAPPLRAGSARAGANDFDAGDANGVEVGVEPDPNAPEAAATASRSDTVERLSSYAVRRSRVGLGRHHRSWLWLRPWAPRRSSRHVEHHGSDHRGEPGQRRRQRNARERRSLPLPHDRARHPGRAQPASRWSPG